MCVLLLPMLLLLFHLLSLLLALFCLRLLLLLFSVATWGQPFTAMPGWQGVAPPIPLPYLVPGPPCRGHRLLGQRILMPLGASLALAGTLLPGHGGRAGAVERGPIGGRGCWRLGGDWCRPRAQ